MPYSFNDVIIEKNISDIAIAYHKERFWNNVTKTDSCWNWNNTNYFRIEKLPFFPSRFSYEITNGKIAEGLKVYHNCNNPKCVKPSHLESLTQKELVLRGNGAPAINKKKSCCIRGHLLTGDNLYLSKNNSRECKICKKARSLKYYKKNHPLSKKIQVFYN